MSEFRFAYPLVLLFLFALPAVYFLPGLRRWRPRWGTMRYSDTRLFRGLVTNWRVRLRRLPDVLRLVAWILLVVALARPQTGNAREVIRGQGIDIVLALDISTSMAALDFEPRNRLEAAKSVIADFIAGREFDRIGLVVFARNAFHQAPLTLDYPVLLRLLDQVQLVSELRQIQGHSLDGTAIGLGLASAANMLRSSTAASKIIILLTDGDNNAGLDPFQAASAASALGIRIYTIGMGRPGIINVPGPEGDLVSVQSDLDEDALRDIAATGGGVYFRAQDTETLEQVYDQIDIMERSHIERVIFVRWRDHAPWLLVPGLLLLVIERIARRTIFQAVP